MSTDLTHILNSIIIPVVGPGVCQTLIIYQASL